MQFPSHRFYEDILALICACTLISLGIVLFNTHELLTGGTTGIAIIGTHLTSLNFGTVFFIVNLPFYYLAWTQLSKRFTVNTFISVTLVSLMTETLSEVLTISYIHPIFAAAAGGMLIAVGILIMYRHKSSLGGLGVLALYLQSKHNIRAGNFGLLVDGLILTASMFIFNLELILLSIIGAITLNILIAVNHRPERYTVKRAFKTLPITSDKVDAALDDDLLNTVK